MSSNDVYGMTDRMDNAVLDVIVTRLETRGKHPFFIRVLDEYLGAMDIGSASNVLDMGCGTGVASRAVARFSGFEGMVTGIDLSTYLIDAATAIAAEEGLDSSVTYLSGDTQQMGLPDQEYDAVILHTLISHVEDPMTVIKEARRVVKPGGRIGIFDGDYATITFGHEDPERGREFDEKIIRAIVTNPRVMRQMPRLISAAGLNLVASFPYALADIGRADFFKPAIESFRKLVPQSGESSEEAFNAWADTQMKDSEEGVFFGASNFYSYVAERPNG